MGIVSEFSLLSSSQVYISTIMADSSKDVTPSSTQRVPTTHRDLFFEDPHFKDNWHNFDKIRDSMFKESRDLWKQMDKDFRKMRCMNLMLTADEGEEEKSAPVAKYEDSWMFPRRWMMPSLPGNLKEHDLFDHDDHEVIRFKEDDKQLEVSLDTSHYRPDELHVHADDKFITIDGKHVETTANGNFSASTLFQLELGHRMFLQICRRTVFSWSRLSSMSQSRRSRSNKLNNL